MTIRITGDGPKITATGSGSTVLVEISTGQHDPGSFSGVHNDLTGRSTTGAHVGTAVSIDPTGFNNNLDGTITNAQLLAAAVDDLTTGGGGGGAVDSVDGRTGVVTLDDLYQTVGVEIATVDTTLAGPPRTVITAIVDGTVTLPTAGVGDVGQHWHISTGPYELTVVGCDGGDVTVPVGMVLSVVGFEGPGPVYGWSQLGFKTIDAPTGGAALSDTTPQALGTAAAGDGTAASRADHVHGMPTAADVGAAAASHTHTGTQVTVDASGFDGNLTTGDDTVQKVAQKVDDLVIPAAGIPATIIDAKGDLIVGTAADTAARLAVGTNGQVLTADSSEAGGVKWAAAGGDVSVAGNCRVFAPQTDGYGWAMWVGGSTVSISNTIVTASFPFTVTEDCTLSTLRIEVVTGAAGATHQLALFSCDVNGTPGSLIETFTAFDCSDTNVKGVSGLTTALHAGSIYVLASLGGATSGHSLRGATTGGGGLVLANGAVVLEIGTVGNLTGGSVGRGAGWRFSVDVPGVMTDPPGGLWAHAPTNLTIPNIGMVLT